MASGTDLERFARRPVVFRATMLAVWTAAAGGSALLLRAGGVPTGRDARLTSAVVLGLLLLGELGLMWRSDAVGDSHQTIGDAFLVPLLVVGGPALALVGTQAALLAIDSLPSGDRERVPWYNRVFNHAQQGLQLLAADVVWNAFGGSISSVREIVAVAAAALVALVVSLALNVLVAASEEPRAAREFLSSGVVRELGMQALILPPLASATAVLARHGPLAPLMMVGSIAAIRYAASQGARRRTAEERLGIDALTALANHQRFWERLESEIDRAGRYDRELSLLLCDIDDFKALNDTYGHQVGDACLVGVAGALRSTARSNDLPCRYGGEEFALILPETDAADAAAVAERLRTALHGCHALGLTGSVGVATWPADGRAPTELVHGADEAMYRAKRGGKDRVCAASALPAAGAEAA